jgi:hypothetical protein
MKKNTPPVTQNNVIRVKIGSLGKENVRAGGYAELIMRSGGLPRSFCAPSLEMNEIRSDPFLMVSVLRKKDTFLSSKILILAVTQMVTSQV